MGFKRPGIAILLLSFLVLLAGCEEAAKKRAFVRPPIQNFVAGPLLADPKPLSAVPPAVYEAALDPPDLTEQVIAEVEAYYKSGEQNYRAGHLEKARRDFDRAVDRLLTSGLDIHADERLERLFDRIVDGIHAYELAAYREGDGFTEQKVEAAPIDEVADLTFPADPRLKEKAEKQIREVKHDLPITVNDYVLSYLNYFQTPRGRAIIETGLRRAGRYREMISRILAEEGLPQDLIYLVQAESAFKPTALSRMGARGLWQFMADRGRQYDLERNWWVDLRQDPEKSTRAAAQHLKDLYRLFGDWYLVLAAYNSGPGNVQKAIERTGYADYWELLKRQVLPRETQNYVPIILAVTIMAKNPDKYGLEVTPDPPERIEKVPLATPTDLRLVAEILDVDLETVRSLNPHLLRMVTPNDPSFELNVPEGTGQKFLNEIATIPEDKRVWWRKHRVEEGETLYEIAHKYKVPLTAIAEVNGIKGEETLKPGDKLIIPAAPTKNVQARWVRYRVRRGESLVGVADKFGVSREDILRWNKLRGSKLPAGRTLRIHLGEGEMGPPAAKQAHPIASKSYKSKKVRLEGEQVFHRVHKGETLWSIAQTYNTTVDAIRQANRFLNSREIQAGDQIVIYQNR